MTRAFLGLGSNLGDRAGYLRSAVASLRDGGLLRRVSPVYETEPVGGPRGQGPYLNLVVELDADMPARELLAVCRRLEAAAGRVRGQRWGPRTLDVDVLWIDGGTVDDPDLQVPHPRMWERRFVLAPLRDLAPDVVSDEHLRHADGHVRTVGELDALG
ncbi:MAG: 2-amino-4-hydroxy-6-hydroxymethyldihydropteridine diphosphokinase [Acidimicrobiales bacterium]